MQTVVTEDVAEAIKKKPDYVDRIMKAAKAGDVEGVKKEATDLAKDGIDEYYKRSALYDDVWCYRGTIIALGSVMVLTAAAALVLGLYQYNIPDLLVAIGSAAVGALAGLIAPQATKR